MIGGLDYFTHEQHGVVDWFRNNERVKEDGYTTMVAVEGPLPFARVVRDAGVGGDLLGERLAGGDPVSDGRRPAAQVAGEVRRGLPPHLIPRLVPGVPPQTGRDQGRERPQRRQAPAVADDPQHPLQPAAAEFLLHRLGGRRPPGLRRRDDQRFGTVVGRQ
jgi:hypothetical protein